MWFATSQQLNQAQKKNLVQRLGITCAGIYVLCMRIGANLFLSQHVENAQSKGNDLQWDQLQRAMTMWIKKRSVSRSFIKFFVSHLSFQHWIHMHDERLLNTCLVWCTLSSLTMKMNFFTNRCHDHLRERQQMMRFIET